MKKLFYFIMMLSPALLFSQRSSIGISGGYTTNGYGGMVEYNHHFGTNSLINSSLYFSAAKFSENADLEVNYNNITLNVGYYNKVFNPTDEKFRIALGGGGLVGYEVLNNGQNIFDSGVSLEGESKVIFGAYVGAQINYFISDFFALSLVANEFYHFNSDLGNFAVYAGIGIKYYVF